MNVPKDPNSARNALCIALDGSDRGWLLDRAQELAGEVGWLKLGLEAFAAHGPDLVAAVTRTGCPVFLDLKLHDIPATVRRAAANCASSGARMMTVHAAGGPAMLSAALEGANHGAKNPSPKVVAVTLLTSLDDGTLEQLGIPGPAEDVVVRWAELAKRQGLDGVVASAREASQIRKACGPDFLIVTPGIRPEWYGTDDQRRTQTPADAIRQGSDILVVGRPVTRATEPVQATRRIVEEMMGTA
jgi:orotidine-5'-phosphate decarboxylase